MKLMQHLQPLARKFLHWLRADRRNRNYRKVKSPKSNPKQCAEGVRGRPAADMRNDVVSRESKSRLDVYIGSLVMGLALVLIGTMGPTGITMGSAGMLCAIVGLLVAVVGSAGIVFSGKK